MKTAKEAAEATAKKAGALYEVEAREALKEIEYLIDCAISKGSNQTSYVFPQKYKALSPEILQKILTNSPLFYKVNISKKVMHTSQSWSIPIINIGYPDAWFFEHTYLIISW